MVLLRVGYMPVKIARLTAGVGKEVPFPFFTALKSVILTALQTTHHTKSGIFRIDLVTGIYLPTELYYDFMPLDNIQETGKILCAIDTVIP